MNIFTHNNVIDFLSILIDRAVVEQVESFKFLGVHSTNKLEWSKHTSREEDKAYSPSGN